MTASTTPIWITATPPTADGELHLGHLAGPYVAADVLRRFLRSDGRPARLTGAIDQFDTAVQLCALVQGRKAEEVADGYAESITVDWQRAGVEFDDLPQPLGEAGYRLHVQDLLAKLHADGVVVARSRLLPYCQPCDRWLHGVLVTGGCPYCGAPARGNVCQSCARPNDCGDLLDPACVLCGTPAQLRQCRRLYLPLEAHRDRLLEFWAVTPMPPRLSVLCEQLTRDGLAELAVSHPADWGIEVTVPEFEDQRIDSRFEHAAAHVLAAHRTTEPPVGSLQFFGYDHAHLQVVVLPALLGCLGLPAPTGYRVNDFYHYQGRKMSTGQRHAVWALDALTDAGSDALRRHVLSGRPLGRPADFVPEELDHARQFLDDTWNPWLTRLFAALREDCHGLVPEARAGGTGWVYLHDRLSGTVAELRTAYDIETFDPRRAIALLDEAVRLVTDFQLVNAYERDRVGGRECYRAALAAQLAVARALAAWAWPAMPEGAARLARALGDRPGGPVAPDALEPPRPGTRLAPPTGPVFGF
ncbi:class I tRNA ligase family protein [Kitasatospora cathayae]|uniref:Class I tRNA ligase family protein n=1 Tax=Kitasatospora cathayae TaxID=3004092 RepID=A0ABY7PXC8_9ACTN|nr:class I tRNA ligase family protein [Kitasatospora sp. HUAS 3-15]WBP85079.1 class I tRNA ligase family protein [Kitasatospora sp. HUAS 3-15]